MPMRKPVEIVQLSNGYWAVRAYWVEDQTKADCNSEQEAIDFAHRRIEKTIQKLEKMKKELATGE